MPLTPKQQRFVEEYLVDLNATQAAIRAGYSPKTAREQAARLLSKVNIQQAVQAGQERKRKRIQLDADWVLKRLRIEAKRTGEGSSHAARVRATELIGKHLDMFTDRQEAKIDVTSKGEQIAKDTLTAADLVAAAALVGMAGGQLPAHGGPQPVDSAKPAPEATPVPAAG